MSDVTYQIPGRITTGYPDPVPGQIRTRPTSHFLYFLPAGPTAGIKTTQVSNFAVYRPVGATGFTEYREIWHSGGDLSVVPNFTLLGEFFGDFRFKNTKICQNNSKVSNFFAPQGRIPRPILVKFMFYMRVTCLRNVLKFGAIWFINDKFLDKNCDGSFYPQIFEAPLAPKLLVKHEKSTWAQSGTDMLYPRAKFGGNKCLFVCLSRLRSVCLWAIGALTVRAILFPFIGQFLCSFQRF